MLFFCCIVTTHANVAKPYIKKARIANLKITSAIKTDAMTISNIMLFRWAVISAKLHIFRLLSAMIG